MKHQSWPLDDSHRQLIDKHLSELAALIPLFEKCQRCGIEMPNECSDCQFLTEQLTAIKQEFFTPGGNPV